MVETSGQELERYIFHSGMQVAVLHRISAKKTKVVDGKKYTDTDIKLENQEGVTDAIVKGNNLKLDSKHIYSETHTGREGEKQRPVLREIFAAAERHEFQILILYAADRLTREGGWEMVWYCRRLHDAGVDVYCHVQSWLDISTQIKEAIVFLIGMNARIESDMNSNRSKRSRERRIAEAEKATKEGHPTVAKLGGHLVVKLTVDELAELKRLRGLGYSVASIADVLAKKNPKITAWVVRRTENEQKG